MRYFKENKGRNLGNPGLPLLSLWTQIHYRCNLCEFDCIQHFQREGFSQSSTTEFSISYKKVDKN